MRKIFIQNNLDENKIMEAKYFHIGALQNTTPVFIEHYPILQKELDFLDKFHIQKISVYSSLDEPMFEHFGSGKIKPMIKFLGMKEDEPIVHAMVSKSIAGAQQKIADKIIIDQHANSQKEWLLKNLK
ncbi:MAG: hypothetical protein IPJ81_09790 [Chitinophagaceae bacterium]|nr:hypothetical protein [Chitinophagaceae bacterium]